MCTEAAQMCCNIRPFLNAIKIIISIIQWSVPILLIVLGTIDMFKAVTTNDEKDIKAAQSTFIKRILYGLAIFLVPFLVRLVLALVEDNIVKDDSVLNDSWLSCWNGNVNCGACKDIYEAPVDDSNSDNPSSDNVDNVAAKTCYVYTVTSTTCDVVNLNEGEVATKINDNECSVTLIGVGIGQCSAQCNLVTTGNLANVRSEYVYDESIGKNLCKCYVPTKEEVTNHYSSNGNLTFSNYKKSTYSCDNQYIDCSDGSFTTFCDLVSSN